MLLNGFVRVVVLLGREVVGTWGFFSLAVTSGLLQAVMLALGAENLISAVEPEHCTKCLGKTAGTVCR